MLDEQVRANPEAPFNYGVSHGGGADGRRPRTMASGAGEEITPRLPPFRRPWRLW